MHAGCGFKLAARVQVAEKALLFAKDFEVIISCAWLALKARVIGGPCSLY